MPPLNLLPTSVLFLNIAPYSPGGEESLARQMVEYAQKTGNRIVLYSLSMHPEGVPALDKVRKQIASYRKLKDCLQGTDVQLGVLVQSILGHWPRTDKQMEKWARTINIDGAPVRFCPLDPDFKEYIHIAMTSLAKENPCLLLTDDDVRAFSHRPECFCQLHTDEFNRRLHTTFSPDELRQKVADSKPGEPIYDTFQQLQRDMVDGLAHFIRQCIDEVNPEIPAGTCCAGEEIRYCGKTAQAIAAKNQLPFFRMANCDYMERSPKDLPKIILRTQQQREAWKEIPIVLDESDTFPHHLYSRSSQSFHAKLCSSLMCGLNGAKLWFINATKQGKPVSQNYLDILARHKGFYGTLAKELPKTALGGVCIPMAKSFPKWHLAHNTQESFLEENSWAEKVLGSFGIPFHCAFPDAVCEDIHAIAGRETVRRFSDEEIRTLLSGKLLVDGEAAVELCQRGFDAFLGLKATDSTGTVFNREYVCDSRQILPCHICGTPLLEVKEPSAAVLSMLAYEPYNQSGKMEDIAPGTVLFRNSLGGTVVTASFHTGNNGYELLNPQRKEWLISLLNLLNDGTFPGIILNEQDICCLRRQGKNHDLLMLFNLNFDPLDSVRITVTGAPSQVQSLQPNGRWKNLPFTVEGNAITIPASLHCYELLTLKIKYLKS